MRMDRDDVARVASENEDGPPAGSEESAQAPIPPRPHNRAQLRAVIHRLLDIETDAAPIIPGHHNVLDYLEHAFFEGRPPRSLLPGASGRDVAPPGDAYAGIETHTPPVVDCVVWANRGGGKTMAGAVATLLDLVFKDGIQVRILGGSMDQSRRMHDHLRGFLERPLLRGLVKGRITDRRITLVNKSSVELLAQSQTSVRGTRVQKVRCDEVELFDPRVWEAAQLVTRSRRCAGHWVLGAVECLSTMHMARGIMHGLVEQAAQGTRRLFKWGLVDCLETCPPRRPCERCGLSPECAGRAKRGPEAACGHITIEDALIMKSRVTIDTWDSEMLCLRPSRSAAVFPEFDPAVHVVDVVPALAATPPPAEPVWVGGMDFGMRSPTVVLWGLVDDRGVLWIVHERSVAGAVIDEHIDAILAPDKPRLRWLAVDPAGRSINSHSGMSTTDAMSRRGIRVQWQQAKVHEGVLLVRSRLRPASGSAPRLYVHRSCSHLVESLERFSYTEPEFSDQPDKTQGFDHAVDALRYLVQRLDRPRRSCAGSYTIHGV